MLIYAYISYLMLIQPVVLANQIHQPYYNCKYLKVDMSKIFIKNLFKVFCVFVLIHFDTSFLGFLVTRFLIA